jgi:RNA polymerase sigma factor (sigma-70 family)
MTPWAVMNPARLAGSGLLRTQSDARLVDLVRAGNDRAFEAIVLRYNRPLLRHCRKLLPAGRAEDAVQQSLLRALEAIRADDRELQLGPWLHRIAHNTAIDSLRRLDSHWEELDERMDGVEPTHAAAERRAQFSAVVSTMGSLPERQRRALVLRELEGRSYEEIAATLGVSGAGVRQLLNRARNTMRAASSAVVPPALVARMAGSQAGVRVAELMDPPGTGALMAKASAALAAGAVAVLAVSGPPSGDGNRVPRAEAGTRQPAAKERPSAGERSSRAATPAAAAGEPRKPRAAGPRRGQDDDGGGRGRGGAVRTAAGPGAAQAGSNGGNDEDSAPGRRAGGNAKGGADDRGGDDGGGVGDDGGGDDDGAGTGRPRRSGDDDDAAPPAGGPAATDDDGVDGSQGGAPVAVTAPPGDDGGDDEGGDSAPAASPAPAATSAPAPSSAPAPQAPAAALDEAAEEPDD